MPDRIDERVTVVEVREKEWLHPVGGVKPLEPSVVTRHLHVVRRTLKVKHLPDLLGTVVVDAEVGQARVVELDKLDVRPPARELTELVRCHKVGCADNHVGDRLVTAPLVLLKPVKELLDVLDVPALAVDAVLSQNAHRAADRHPETRVRARNGHLIPVDDKDHPYRREVRCYSMGAAGHVSLVSKVRFSHDVKASLSSLTFGIRSLI